MREDPGKRGKGKRKRLLSTILSFSSSSPRHDRAEEKKRKVLFSLFIYK